MPFFQSLSVTLLWLFILIVGVDSVRDYDRRRDLRAIHPVSELGWSVPLVGSMSCTANDGCYQALSRPGENKTLEVLAIGRGSLNYSCEGLMPANPPAFVAQYTELFNAAALANVLPNEQSFHELIPSLLQYDYATLANSTLECMGSIGTLNSLAVITLYHIGTFQVSPFEHVNPPGNASVDGVWSHSLSSDFDWEVYRVEVAGGAVPKICAGQNDHLDLEYVAEYWFYR